MLDTIRLSISDLRFYHAVCKWRENDLGGIVPARIDATALREMLSGGKAVNLNDYKDKQIRELLDDLNEHGLNIVIKDFFQLFNQGSFSRDISMVVDEHNLRIITEVSLPKFFMGQNVDLLYDYKSRMLDFVSYLYQFFRIPVPSSEQIRQIEVIRADICYFYKFQSQIHAFDFINAFKVWSKHKRKKVHHYDTSMMFVGSSYSLKFYMKYDEFQKHDKRFILKNIVTLLEKNSHQDSDKSQIADYHQMIKYCDSQSLGMVRSEFTLRKKKLNYDSIKTIGDLIDKDICSYYETLLDKLGVLIMGHSKKDDYFNKLKADKKLLQYCALVETFGSDKVCEIYDRSVIYKYKKLLMQMNIHLSDFSILKEVSLKVRDSDKQLVDSQSDNYLQAVNFINGKFF